MPSNINHIPALLPGSNTGWLSLAGLNGPDAPFPSVIRIRISVQGTIPSIVPPVSIQATNPTGPTTGSEVMVSDGNLYPSSTVAIEDGSGPSAAANAGWETPHTNNVYFLKIIIFSPSTTFEIRIENNSAAAWEIVWVEADTDDGSQQPWIDVTPAELNYNHLITESDTQAITVTNKGTGAFNITGLNPTLGTGFSLPMPSPLPATVAPNNSIPLQITFAAPSTPADTASAATTVVIDPPDLGASTTTGHNQQVTLNTQTQELEIVLLLDTSGSMGWQPNGDRTGPLTSRWEDLEDAADQFLALLLGFGDSRGRFGIVRYPGTDLTNLTTYVLFAPQTIEPAQISSAQAQLSLTPDGGTPMGDGLAVATSDPGGAIPTPGYFTNTLFNRRWLLLMSDGYNNDGIANPRDFIAPDAAPGESLADKFIKVYSVAYGTADGKQVNAPLLQDIANGSYEGGEFLRVNPEPGIPGPPVTALEVAQRFRKVILSGLTTTMTSPTDPRGLLHPGAAEVRHQVTITPYDTKVAFTLNWNTPDADRVRLELLTPNCEHITPESVDSGGGYGYGYGYGYGSNEQDITIQRGRRYLVYFINQDYLRNSLDPSSPRYGIWQLIVSSSAIANSNNTNTPQIDVLSTTAASANNFSNQEYYDYDVIIESQLQLKVNFDRDTYYAGDPIGLSAKLTTAGKPILKAAVRVEVTSPGQSIDNWVATAKVTPEELAQAAEAFVGQDINPLAIKVAALREKGVFFDSTTNTTTLVMEDRTNRGTYTTTFSQTFIPESYKFYVTAVGSTDDAVLFRREAQVETYILVKPDPQCSLISLQDIRTSGQGLLSANAVVTLRDCFNNILLFDPEYDPVAQLTLQNGSFTGDLISNLDGTYTQSINFSPDAAPVIGIQAKGENIVSTKPIGSIAQTKYVDQIIDFELGGEAESGANQHRDPQAALGDVVAKGSDEFVSLGAFGVLTVGIDGQVIVGRGDDDITIYVKPDEDLRPYLVEALPGDFDTDWIEVGTSAGVTQSFSLRKANIKTAKWLRITDRSGQTRDSQFNPSPTPGVGILGVGIKQTSLAPTMTPSVADVIHIEAEDLDLVNYRIEDQEVASGGKVISLLNSNADSGTASMTFSGPSGYYTVVVAYFDDIDGKAILRLKVNDTLVDSWRLNQNLDPQGNVPTEKNRTRRTIGGVALTAGDTLTIEGQRDQSDWARVDFIQLIHC